MMHTINSMELGVSYYRIILPCLIFGSVSVSYADSVVQTDWTGGSGVSGPVAELSDQLPNETDSGGTVI